MKALFIQNNAINESFVITDIVSFLKKQHHEVDLLISSEEKKNLIKKINNFSPDILIFPAPIFDIKNYLTLAQNIKKITGIKTLFWGSAATFYPKQLLKNSVVDYICQGEGEQAINELLINIINPQKTKTIKILAGKLEKKYLLIN
jgi:radical SAM superfamily enzyme YgiQ (UPF0313 family)